jgi:hypothetical protein
MSTTSSTNTFDIGDKPTLVFTFTDEDGVLTTPTAVDFTQRAPDGTETAKTIVDATEESTGVLSWPIPAPFDAPGTWKFRAAATAPFFTAEELTLKVRKSAFA